MPTIYWKRIRERQRRTFQKLNRPASAAVIIPPRTEREAHAMWSWRAYVESIPYAAFKEVQDDR